MVARIDTHKPNTHRGSQTSPSQKQSKQSKSIIISSGFRVSVIVEFLKFILRENLLVDSQGLAPSATISMRSELKLMSLWSLWARRDQCMSLDFTTATRAIQETKTHTDTRK